MKDNDFFLKLAKNEALKAGAFVHPNPYVGCVIVKNGRILSKGYHKIFGGAHAEVNAIKKLSLKELKGSTLYVTLEPCSTYGKTPPCTDLIIKSGIKKVVIGTVDPNPLHNGKGIDILKKHGIEVELGSEEIERELKTINASFNKNMIKKMPYVVLKFASSIDGKIANRNYISRWISSEKSRVYAHRLRALSDCIIVGANTVIKDNPRLDVRYAKTRKQPSVCVIDRNLKIDINSNIFLTDRKVFIVSDREEGIFKNKAIFITPRIKNGEVDLKDLLKKLYQNGVRNVLVEGGGKTIGSFIKQDMFDKIYFFVSPLITGSDGINSVNTNLGLRSNCIGIRLKIERVLKIGEDVLIEITK